MISTFSLFIISKILQKNVISGHLREFKRSRSEFKLNFLLIMKYFFCNKKLSLFEKILAKGRNITSGKKTLEIRKNK